VRKRLARASLRFHGRRQKMTGQYPDADRTPSTTQGDSGCLPEPEPESSHSHMHKPEPRLLLARVEDPGVADRFEEWIEPWPRVADRALARRHWIARVTPETVEGAFACRDRYLASDEVVNRGAIQEPWKFVCAQADNGWTGKWPAARDRSKDSPQARKQAAIDAEWAEVANGSPQT
jgi:hypothetical protein